MRFESWLTEFLKDKREVPLPDQASTYAIHTIRRFIDKKNCVWEIAFTYTGRLVIRSGSIGADALTIKWGEWETDHEVELTETR